MNKTLVRSQQDLLYQICSGLKALIYQNKNELEEVIKSASLYNPWFEPLEINRMLDLIFSNYLNEEKLTSWLSKYSFKESSEEQVVGIVSAGNIPLASFQDVWCALACGYSIQLKLSSKDLIFSKYFYEKLNSLITESHPKIQIVEKLANINKLLASGSNLTANHFKKYLDRFPCLVRSHRNGIAILSGKETEQELIALGNDIFYYFGLGCRNVTKIYIPDVSVIFILAKVLDDHFAYVKENSKYINNYNYQLAVLSLNRNAFYQGQTIFFNESNSVSSSIAVLNYEIYNSLSIVESEVKAKLDHIQCISTNLEELSLKTVKLGKAQWPQLWDYQDEIDVIQFLQN